MHSFTSNFERPKVLFNWPVALAGALLLWLMIVVMIEWRLRELGYQPTIQDNRQIWMRERLRASESGSKALILIGASRIQLGIDLDSLHRLTGLTPIQLAIDGSAPGPVLRGLAEDPTITGTILVDLYPSGIGGTAAGISGYQDGYDQLRRTGRLDRIKPDIETSLTGFVKENLSLYADGATPYLSITYRLIPGLRQGQYLVTHPDRSRTADYSLLPMPRTYYYRTLRTLGIEGSVSPDDPDIHRILRKAIDAEMPVSNIGFRQHTAELATLSKTIERRGGRVIFINMPTSGMVREIEERRFPRELFWDYFRQHIGTRSFSANYSSELGSYRCPDGSHLDQSDRRRFTEILVKVLGLQKPDDDGSS